MKLIDNRYKVNRLINENAYNSVYEVVDLWDNDRILFLKLYNIERQKKVIEYFINNFITFSRIKHRNLLASKQFSILKSIDNKKVRVKQYYSTAEYVNAPSLDKIEENLSFKDKLNIILQICSILDFLHYRGIVYKHLSPTNIFIDNDNVVKLKDIASIYENVINANYDNMTRFFIAPEILIQQDENTDTSADKYSLGQLMIYLFTDNFNGSKATTYNYKNNEQMEEIQKRFLDDVISNLTNTNCSLRNINLRDLISDIKKMFNLDYEYDLVKERNILNFKTRIIGKDKELKKILDIDDDLIKGYNYKKLILINGDRGVGKTRFLNEIAFLLNMKGRDIYNIEITSNNSIEFMPITNILRQTIKDTPLEIQQKYAREFIEILPELKLKLNGKISNDLNKTTNRLRLYDRITNYFEDLAKQRETPIYLIIDNIGEASVELLFLLDYIIRNIAYGNLMVIASLNQKIIPKDSNKLNIFNGWLKEKYTETIKLSNLDLNEIGEFIQQILGINYKPLNFSAVMLKESKGNPKYIEYMLKDLYAKGELYFHENGYWNVKAQKYSDIYFPSSLDEAIKNQIGIIEKDYMSIMKVVSCFQSSISKATLYNMVELENSELDAKLQELTTMRLIDEMVSDWGYSYSINNIELKKLIYYRISKNERMEIHRKIAGILEDRYRDNIDMIMEELIYQLVSSNQKEKAIKLITSKARNEESKFGLKALYLWDEAYEIAKDVREDLRVETLEALARIYFMRGEKEKAINAYKELYEESIKIKNLKYAAIAKLGVGEIYLQKNLINEAQKKIIEGFKISEEIEYKYGIAKSKILYCRILLNKNKFDQLDEKLSDVLEYSIKNELKDITGDIYNIKGLLEYYRGNVDKSIEYYNKSISYFNESNEYIYSIKPMNNIAVIYSDQGNYNKAMKYYEEALNITDKVGIPSLKLTCLNNIGDSYMSFGNFDKAKTYIEEARSIASDIEDISGKFITSINLGLIYLNNNDYYNSYNIYKELKKDFAGYENFNIGILSQYFDFLGEFYYYFGKWEESREWSNKVMEICKDYDELSYLLAESRIVLIDFYQNGKYDSNKFETIRSKFRNTNYSFYRRKFLIEVALIAFIKKEYDYVLDVLDEDCKLLEEYPSYYLDNMRKILLYTIESNQESNMNLEKLGEELKNEKLIIVKIFYNIVLGNKFCADGNYYKAFNYISEAIDLLYRIVRDIPEAEFQISLMKKTRTDSVKKLLFDIIDKVFGEKLDYYQVENLNTLNNIDKYFDYSSLLGVMNETQYTKLVENNALYTHTRDINDILTLMERLNDDYKHNLQMILEFLSKETLAQRGYILMYDEEINKYSSIVSLGGAMDFKPNQNLLSLANRYKNGILLSTSLESNVVGLYREFLPKGTKALICVPIRISEDDDFVEVERRKSGYDSYQKHIGYIYLETDRLFNRFDKARHRLVEVLTSIIYINMENYRLKILSSIDKLTGTYTRKYFDVEMNKAINEARRLQQSFGLLMIDIDNFKLFNDTYGHRIGDEVLFKVGSYLVSNIRKTDMVARYGGEEFIIILNNVDEEQAYIIGDKLRKGVANLTVPTIKKNITISIGISLFPKHGQFKEELIIKADQALYNAKEKGKNRIEIWNPNLTNTLNRVDRLAGILSGNINSDERNLLAILEVINIAKDINNRKKKIFEFLGRITETMEAESCSLIEIDKDQNISQIYSRSRLKQEWVKNPYINVEIVRRVIKNVKGEFLIDWENEYEKDIVLNTPNWHSVMAIPLVVNNRIKGVGYMTVPIKEKEFDYNSYNLAKMLWDLFALSYY